MIGHAEEISATDCTSIHVHDFRPDSGTWERTLVIVHGLSEHGERYAHVAQFFTDLGWRVLIGDLRGHGRSGGCASHVTHFDQYLHDLDLLWEHYRLDPRRTAVLGHSMGALVSIRYLETRPDRCAALVLLSPLLEIRIPVGRAKKAVGRVLSWIAPRFRFRTNIDVNNMSRDPAVIARRLADPLIRRTVTARWFFAVQDAMRHAHQEASQIALPVLVMQGGSDATVDPHVVEPWLSRTSATEAEFRMLPEHLHELLNEPDWRETAAIIQQWLLPRVAAAPQHTGRGGGPG